MYVFLCLNILHSACVSLLSASDGFVVSLGTSFGQPCTACCTSEGHSREKSVFDRNAVSGSNPKLTRMSFIVKHYPTQMRTSTDEKPAQVRNLYRWETHPCKKPIQVRNQYRWETNTRENPMQVRNKHGWEINTGEKPGQLYSSAGRFVMFCNSDCVIVIRRLWGVSSG